MGSMCCCEKCACIWKMDKNNGEIIWHRNLHTPCLSIYKTDDIISCLTVNESDDGIINRYNMYRLSQNGEYLWDSCYHFHCEHLVDEYKNKSIEYTAMKQYEIEGTLYQYNNLDYIFNGHELYIYDNRRLLKYVRLAQNANLANAVNVNDPVISDWINTTSKKFAFNNENLYIYGDLVKLNDYNVEYINDRIKITLNTYYNPNFITSNLSYLYDNTIIKLSGLYSYNALVDGDIDNIPDYKYIGTVDDLDSLLIFREYEIKVENRQLNRQLFPTELLSDFNCVDIGSQIIIEQTSDRPFIIHVSGSDFTVGVNDVNTGNKVSILDLSDCSISQLDVNLIFDQDDVFNNISANVSSITTVIDPDEVEYKYYGSYDCKMSSKYNNKIVFSCLCKMYLQIRNLYHRTTYEQRSVTGNFDPHDPLTILSRDSVPQPLVDGIGNDYDGPIIGMVAHSDHQFIDNNIVYPNGGYIVLHPRGQTYKSAAGFSGYQGVREFEGAYGRSIFVTDGKTYVHFVDDDFNAYTREEYWEEVPRDDSVDENGYIIYLPFEVYIDLNDHTVTVSVNDIYNKYENIEYLIQEFNQAINKDINLVNDNVFINEQILTNSRNYT